MVIVATYDYLYFLEMSYIKLPNAPSQCFFASHSFHSITERLSETKLSVQFPLSLQIYSLKDLQALSICWVLALVWESTLHTTGCGWQCVTVDPSLTRWAIKGTRCLWDLLSARRRIGFFPPWWCLAANIFFLSQPPAICPLPYWCRNKTTQM